MNYATEPAQTMIQLSRNYSLPEKKRRRSRDQNRRRRRRGLERARPHRARRNGQGRNDRDQHRRAIARQLGRDDTRCRSAATVTRGLGAGGDPELGYNAAQESADEIREALHGCADGFHLRRAWRRHRFGRGAVRRADRARDRRARHRIRDSAFRFRRKTPQSRRRWKRCSELHESPMRVICFENDRMGDMVAAQGRDSSGVRRRRHDHQPERALDRECRSGGRASSGSVSTNCSPRCAVKTAAASSVSANPTATTAPTKRSRMP